MDTSQKIIEASIKVFTKYGYLGGTTKEIALTANVSEMTLFRKFQSKQNLFNKMIESTLGRELSGVTEIDLSLSLRELIKELLHSRLMVISSSIDLVRMIIQESILGRIPLELDYVTQISRNLKNTLKKYQDKHVKTSKVYLDSVISGLLLNYAIMTPDIKYNYLSDIEQKKYLNNLITQINI